jgi:hypothetical protein
MIVLEDPAIIYKFISSYVCRGYATHHTTLYNNIKNKSIQYF